MKCPKMCGLMTSPGSSGESTSSASVAKARREQANAPIAAEAPALRNLRLLVGVSMVCYGFVRLNTKSGSRFQAVGPHLNPIPSHLRLRNCYSPW
jgi:hypothetical protein